MSRRRRIALWLGIPLLAVVLTLGWLLGTASGLRFVLARVEHATGGALSVRQANGRLLGPLSLDGLRYRDGQGLDARVTHVDLDLRALALLRAHVHVLSLTLRGVDVALPASPSPARPSSRSFDPRAPVQLALDGVEVDGLRVHRGAADLFVADRIDLAGAWTDKGVELRSLRLRAPAGTAELDARVAFMAGHPGNAHASFDWHAGGKRISGRLTARSDGHTATAKLALARPLRAQLDLSMGTRGAHAWTGHLTLPQGPTATWLGTGAIKQLAADLKAHGDMQQAHASGTLDLDGQRVALDALDVRDAHGMVQLDRLQLKARGHPGSLTARGRINLEPASPTAQLTLAWNDVVVPARLAGQVLATHGTLQFDGSADHYRADLDARAGPPGQLDHVVAQIEGTPGRLAIRQLAVVQPEGSLKTTGTLNYGSGLAWQLSGTASRFDPGRLLAGWHGALDGTLDSRGQAKGDALKAQLEVKSLKGTLRGQPLDARGSLSLSPQKVVAGHLALRYGSGHLQLDGAPGTRNRLDVDLRIGALGDWLAQARGGLTASARIDGAWPRLAIKGQLDGHDLSWHDQSASRLTARLGMPDMRTIGGTLALTARDVHGGGFNFDSVRVDGHGKAAAHDLDVVAKGDPLGLRLALHGGLKGSAWHGQLARLDLALSKQPNWHLKAPVALAFDRGQATLGQACLSAGAPQWCVSAERQRNGALHARYRMHQLPLEMVLALAANDLPMRATGTLEGDGELRRSATGVLSGQARVQSARGSVFYVDEPQHPLLRYRALDTHLDLSTQQQQLRISAQLQDSGQLDGDLRLQGPRHALDGQVRMHLDNVHFIELFTSAVANVEGTLDANVQLAGTLGQPALRGQARIDGLGAEVPALGLKLDQGQLAIDADASDALRVAGRVHSGKGTLRIAGSAGLGAGAPLDLTLRGQQFTVADIPSARAVLSPDLSVKRTADAVQINGTLGVDSANVQLEKLPGAGATQASPDVVVVDADTPPPPAPNAVPVRTDLSVDLGDKTHVKGYGLDGNLHGTLRVLGRPGGVPQGQGQIRVDGTFRAYGQDLSIKQGRLLFAGTPLDNPGLDIRAVRKLNPNATVDDGSEVGLQVRGTAKRPVLTVFSNPVMEQSDALSYLITGKPLSQVRGGEGNMVASAAQALGSATGDLLAKSVGSRLGISDIGVSSNDALGTSAFTVGKYLSPRLYLSYGVGLFQPGQVVTLRYILSRRWNFEAQQSTVSSRASFNYRYER